MRRIRYIILGLLLIALSVFLAQFLMKEETVAAKTTTTPRPPKKINPLLLELLNDYDKEITDLAQEANTPGAAIAVVQDSSIVFIKPYGVKNAGTTDSIDVNTVFRIASVS